MIWRRAKVGRKREAVSSVMGVSDSRNRDLDYFSGFGQGSKAQIICLFVVPYVPGGKGL